MELNTLFNLGDSVEYKDATWKIVRVKVEQSLYSDKSPRVYYYITNEEPKEILKWVNENEIEQQNNPTETI